MAQYGNPDYWEERYSKDTDHFDWYQRWTGVREIFNRFTSPNQRCLHLGCGNSKMAEDMYEDGYLSSVSIDLNARVIETMKARYRDKPSLEFIQMDARKLQFEDSSFELAVDKGTLDSILCGENSTAHSLKYISEVYRVLSPGGVFLIVSFNEPSQRVPYLTKNEFQWEVSHFSIPKPVIPTNPSAVNDGKDGPGVHYVYVCVKT
jgi:ubiquinone/menaquinone biosynthesis C-methylase UbiE